MPISRQARDLWCGLAGIMYRGGRDQVVLPNNVTCSEFRRLTGSHVKQERMGKHWVTTCCNKPSWLQYGGDMPRRVLQWLFDRDMLFDGHMLAARISSLHVETEKDLAMGDFMI